MIKILLALSLLSGGAFSADKPTHKNTGADFTRFKMVPEYFSCDIPKTWTSRRDPEREQKNRVYKLELTAPGTYKAPVTIYAVYYSTGNTVFKNYTDFIERNSKNILGETQSDTEKFSPVKQISLNGKKAFEFESEIQEYLHPESKSDEAVVIKEKFYVIPSSSGFFALRYYAPKSSFNRHLGVFKRISSTFKIQ